MPGADQREARNFRRGMLPGADQREARPFRCGTLPGADTGADQREARAFRRGTLPGADHREARLPPRHVVRGRPTGGTRCLRSMRQRLMRAERAGGPQREKPGWLPRGGKGDSILQDRSSLVLAAPLRWAILSRCAKLSVAFRHASACGNRFSFS